MTIVVTLTQILVPSNPKSETLCQVKLSCSGGSLTNVPFTIVLCESQNFGGHCAIRYWHGQNLPEGTNTLSLNVPWCELYNFCAGGYYYLFGSSQEPVNLLTDGFKRNEGALPAFTYE